MKFNTRVTVKHSKFGGQVEDLASFGLAGLPLEIALGVATLARLGYELNRAVGHVDLAQSRSQVLGLSARVFASLGCGAVVSSAVA